MGLKKAGDDLFTNTFSSGIQQSINKLPKSVGSNLSLGPDGKVLRMGGANNVREVGQPQRLRREVLWVRLRRPQTLKHHLVKELKKSLKKKQPFTK